MVFALPTMQPLYSLEVSVVSSLVQSGIGTVCLDNFCCCCLNIVVLIGIIIKESTVLFLLDYNEFVLETVQELYKDRLNDVPKGWRKRCNV